MKYWNRPRRGSARKKKREAQREQFFHAETRRIFLDILARQRGSSGYLIARDLCLNNPTEFDELFANGSGELFVECFASSIEDGLLKRRVVSFFGNPQFFNQVKTLLKNEFERFRVAD